MLLHSNMMRNDNLPHKYADTVECTNEKVASISVNSAKIVFLFESITDFTNTVENN